MWDNIGEKIKDTAVVLFGFGALVLGIGGIIFVLIDRDYIKYVLPISGGGILILLVICYLLYGFGEIVQRVCDVTNDYFERKEREDKEKAKRWQPPVTRQDDALAKLERLTRLKERGAISEEEYNKKKEEILKYI